MSTLELPEGYKHFPIEAIKEARVAAKQMVELQKIRLNLQKDKYEIERCRIAAGSAELIEKHLGWIEGHYDAFTHNTK